MADIEIKTLEEFRNILSEEIRLEIKARIDESLSRNLYHFCSVPAAENILRDGRFHLSHIDRHKTEAGIAKSVSKRNKAIFPYKKVVTAVNNLPSKENEGAIYKVKNGGETVPPGACYIFKNGGWQYLQGSENANAPEAKAKKNTAFGTKMNDGRVSYVNDDEPLKGEYYMCFSRVPGSFDGYSGRMALRKWGGTYVRFSINGDVLNSRYKGGPVNFYTDNSKIDDKLKNAALLRATKGSDSRFKKINQQTTHEYGEDIAGQIDRIKTYEHEDRLFSNEQDIPSKKRNGANIFNTKIVERIDIFVDRSYLENRNYDNDYVLNQVGNILTLCKKYGELKKVHIYDTEKGLSLLPIQNEIEKANQYMKGKLYEKFKDYIELNRADLQRACSQINVTNVEQKLSDSELKTIGDLISILCYGDAKDDATYNRMVKSIIKGYGLTKFEDGILQHVPPMSFYDSEISESYIGFTLKIIKGAINNFQGWKIQKVADVLRRMMNDYVAQKGLKTFNSITAYKTKQWKKLHGEDVSDKRKKNNPDFIDTVFTNLKDTAIKYKKFILNELKSEVFSADEDKIYSDYVGFSPEYIITAASRRFGKLVNEWVELLFKKVKKGEINIKILAIFNVNPQKAINTYYQQIIVPFLLVVQNMLFEMDRYGN